MDTYYWSKNSGPPPEKNVDKNQLLYKCHSLIRNIGTIVKSYHVSRGGGCWTEEEQDEMDRTILSRDLTPYVFYSLNKHKRWDVVNYIGVEYLEYLESIHDDMMDVMMIERLSTQPVGIYGACRFFPSVNITQAHKLIRKDNGGSEYWNRSVKSGYGQYLSNFEEKNREYSVKKPRRTKETPKRTYPKRCKPIEEPKEAGRTIVVYNIIDGPKSKKKMTNEIYIDHRYYRHYPYCLYSKRKTTKRENTLRIKYYQLDNPLDDDNYYDYEDEEEDDQLIWLEDNRQVAQCYNFDNHFVKKPRKISESSWSICSQ